MRTDRIADLRTLTSQHEPGSMQYKNALLLA
jgi:hypothetical protein